MVSGQQRRCDHFQNSIHIHCPSHASNGRRERHVGCKYLKYRATEGRKIGDLRWLGAERNEMKRRGGRVAENPVSLWICRPC